jgi:SAM-dependent methyltransferase
MSLFDEKYFERYYKKNIFGLQKGRRPFLYFFWMRKLKKLVRRNSKVLEAGCGAGYFLRCLERRYDVAGMDISQAALQSAGEKTKAELYCGSVEKLPFKDSTFAAIIAFDLLEHLNSPEMFLKESKRVLSEGGIIVISTPNPDSFGSRIKPRMPEFKGLPYEKRMNQWFGWRDYTHINIKKRGEWRNLLKDNGFKIIEEGTDTLWDIPYFKNLPNILQKVMFMPLHWGLTCLFGFFPWSYGENYICIARRN